MPKKARHVDHIPSVTTNLAAYGKSAVPDSPFFEAIMSRYHAVGSKMSIRKFWDEVVKVADPNISNRMWVDFMKKFRSACDMRKAQILRKVEDVSIADAKLEEDGIRKILALANITLEDLVSDPELLAKIDKKMLMSWFFQSMKARDSRANVALKKREDDRKQTVYEEIMEDAQYGGDSSMEIDSEEDDFVPPEEELPALPPAHVFEPPMPAAVAEEHERERTGARTVTFDPNEL